LSKSQLNIKFLHSFIKDGRCFDPDLWRKKLCLWVDENCVFTEKFIYIYIYIYLLGTVEFLLRQCCHLLNIFFFILMTIKKNQSRWSKSLIFGCSLDTGIENWSLKQPSKSGLSNAAPAGTMAPATYFPGARDILSWHPILLCQL
jgi:hypothetical protein